MGRCSEQLAEFEHIKQKDPRRMLELRESVANLEARINLPPRLPATLTPEISVGNRILQIGTGQSGLLLLQGIWVAQTMILIENGMHAQ